MSEEKPSPYKVITSESGKYTLEVTSIATKPGCWNYTHGVVKRGSQTIAEVKRNYSSFPFLFIEGHPNGHDYLVCGADYQGQTVIELDTGERRDFLPPEAAKGHGFCWADYTFDTHHKVLVVDGCYWACPYEYRFYDFSDPMNKGWPELKIVDGYVASEGIAPTINPDGTIVTYETRRKGELAGKDYLEWEDEDEENVVVATKTYRREGDTLVFADSWVDEEEQKRRAASQAAREEYERKWEEYKSTNPIFLLVMDRAKKPPFVDSEYSLAVGQCYDGWHPTEKFKDSRICKTLLDRPRDEEGRMIATGWKVEVEWGRNSAPVKLCIFKDGKSFEDKWYEHSVEGMTQALNYAEQVVTG